MQVLGIDLGTTNSIAAIANHVFGVSEDGQKTLPSVVAFLPNGYTLVGETARRRRVIDGENTIYSSKRIIGRVWNDSRTTIFRKRYPFNLVEGEDGRPLFETRSGRFTATQIASMVLSRVFDCARSIPTDFAVNVTVPATFSSAQRVATAEAAELAGLRPVHLLAEPLATAYAYLSLPRAFRRVLVYDLGGGTFDCAVIDCARDRPEMIAQSSDLLLGGDDIDQRLADWVARYVLEKYNWDLTNYAEIQCRLLARCEEAKIKLSTHEEAVIELSQLDPECPAADDGVTVTRSLLEELSTDLVRRSFVICDAVLRASDTRPEEIDSVFLAGGTTLLPSVQEGVRAYFGRPGMLEFDPTEVVARGACLAPPANRVREPSIHRRQREDDPRRIETRIDLLLVAAYPRERSRLRSMLESSDAPHFQVSEVADVEEGLRMLHERAFDAVLLDLTLPAGSDLDMLMRARVAAADTPIVVLAAKHAEDKAIEALRAGAQDYLTREECTPRRLSRAIHQAVERHDILAELQAARNREHFLATHDGLTGLPNRECFLHKIPSALAQARRNGREAGLLFIDLDHFKAINDSLGHAAGDQLLKFVAERLSMGIRATDTVARLAGDEFVLFLPDVPDSRGTATVAQHLLQILSEPYFLDGHESWITASIGVAVFPVDGETAEGLLRNSDMAMYRAKLNGRNNFQFCTESMNAAASRKILIRDRLQEAFEQDRLSVAYQPIRDTRTGRVTAAEALLRWTDLEAESVHPDEFIPVAEDTGLIVPIGEWVLRTVCTQNRAWQDQGYEPIRISVNVSARQLRQHTLVATIAEILRESDLSPESLELEITESSLVQSDSYTRNMLLDLGRMGISLSIDDFGTGYCALSYLSNFHFNRVKIDRSFVEDVAENSDASALTSAIMLMAKSLKLASVVEGIETEEQAAVLSAQGCDEFQGFLFGAPVSADEFTKFLYRSKDD